MPDRLVDPMAGPDSMLSTSLPPSRGQHHTITALALQLLGCPPPENRLQASITIVRLRQALDDTATERPTIAEVQPF